MFQLIDLQIREQICESEKVTQLFGITTSKADLARDLHSSKVTLFDFTARKMAQSQCENSQLSAILCWYHKTHQKRFLFNQLCRVTLSAIFTRNVNYNLCDNKKPGVAVYPSTSCLTFKRQIRQEKNWLTLIFQNAKITKFCSFLSFWKVENSGRTPF